MSLILFYFLIAFSCSMQDTESSTLVLAELSKVEKTRTLLVGDFVQAWKRSHGGRESALGLEFVDQTKHFLARQKFASIEDLKQLHQATRNSINDIRFSYAYALEDYRNNTTTRNNFEFAMSGSMIRFGEYPDFPKKNGSKIFSFDGDKTRTVYSKPGGEQFGIVQSVINRSQFVDFNFNPLVRSLLLDLRQLLGTKYSFHDFMAFADRADKIHVTKDLILGGQGRRCVVACDFNHEVWMDVDKNFAVVKSVKYKKMDENLNWSPAEVVSFGNFVDFGNGLFLPLNFQIDYYLHDKNEVYACAKVTVKDLKINQGLPRSYFSDVFPDGTLIQDNLSGTAYKSGMTVSIGQILDEQILDKRPEVFKNTFVVFCAVICFFSGIVIHLVWFSIRTKKVISVFAIGILFPCSLFAQDSNRLIDSRYKNSCGQIASYASLRTLGVNEVSFEDLANDARWKQGEKTSLKQIEEYLEGFGSITAKAVRLGPVDLKQVLNRKDSVAILAIRSQRAGEIDHAACAFEATNKGLLLIDYPQVRRAIKDVDLEKIWDGEAIIIQRRGVSFPTCIGFSLLFGVLGLFFSAWISKRGLK